MTLYLGVDGGGTFARAAVIDDAGTVRGTSRGSTSNPFSIDEATALGNLHDVVRAAIRDAGDVPVERAVYALAGVSTRRDAEQATMGIRRSELAKLVPAFEVTNDTLAALWSARRPLPAVALIAGTGSHCLGVTPAGAAARALGLEYVLSDEGSAFDIGLRAARAAVRAVDRRGPQTMLAGMVAEALGARTLSEMFDRVRGHSVKTSLAGLAPVVDHAALAGDHQAIAILRYAARALFAAVAAVVERLGIGDEELSVVLIGGVLQHSELVRARLTARIEENFPRANVVLLSGDGAVGAALLARDDVRIDLWSCYERPIATDEPGPSSDSGRR